MGFCLGFFLRVWGLRVVGFIWFRGNRVSWRKLSGVVRGCAPLVVWTSLGRRVAVVGSSSSNAAVLRK